MRPALDSCVGLVRKLCHLFPSAQFFPWLWQLGYSKVGNLMYSETLLRLGGRRFLSNADEGRKL